MMFSSTKQSILQIIPVGILVSGVVVVSNFFASPVLAAPAELGAVKSDLTGGDPLGSMQWPDMKGQFFDADAKTVFDSRIKVTVPLFAEDAMNVPVSFDASALGKVKKSWCWWTETRFERCWSSFPRKPSLP